MKINMITSAIPHTIVLPVFPKHSPSRGCLWLFALLKDKEVVVFNVVCAGNK